MDEPAISVCGATKILSGRKVLDAVDLRVPAGSAWGLVGPSGSGKTTLLRVLLGLQTLDSGTARVRGPIGWVPQDAAGSLDPSRTVAWSVTEGLAIRGRLRDRIAEARRLLSRVGLGEELLERRPSGLSGGQCQRVCIARALSLGPAVLLADEPVSALDASVTAQIVNLLIDLRRSEGLTLLLVSHSVDLVRAVCDGITMMRDGKVVASE